MLACGARTSAAHGARDLKKNTAHLLGTTEMKFRIIEDQRETFPIRVLCDVMGVSAAEVFMPGAVAPKAHARQPIAPCSPRSGAFIWPIAGRYGAPRIRAALREPGAHGKAAAAVERLMRHHDIRAINSATVPDMQLRTAVTIGPSLPPAQSELRCRSAQSSLACRHNLCANLGRLALSGCRARSFTRKIVGWAMRDHIRAELTIAALTRPSNAKSRRLAYPSLGSRRATRVQPVVATVVYELTVRARQMPLQVFSSQGFCEGLVLRPAPPPQEHPCCGRSGRCLSGNTAATAHWYFVRCRAATAVRVAENRRPGPCRSSACMLRHLRP